MEKASRGNFMGTDSIFAVRLSSLMKGQRKTQEDIARVMDISRQAVSQYTEGKTQPTIEKLYRVADYLGVSADYLLGLCDVKSADLQDKEIGKALGLTDEAIEILKKANTDKKPLLQCVNVLLDASGVEVVESIWKYLNTEDLEQMALPNDLIKAYYGTATNISREEMRLIGLLRVQEKLRQLKEQREGKK